MISIFRRWIHLNPLLVLVFLMMAVNSTQVKAETLQGSVQTTEVLPLINNNFPNRETKLLPLAPKLDSSVARPKEDCICFNPNKIDIQRIDNRIKLVDGNNWLLDFDQKADDAKQAFDLIKHYKLTKMCFAGRPATSIRDLMMYFLTDDQAPEGPFDGEDAISFNPNNVEAKQINGSWKVVDGEHWMLDFGQKQQAAVNAVAFIRYYQFQYLCFVGRNSGAKMMYFRK